MPDNSYIFCRNYQVTLFARNFEVLTVAGLLLTIFRFPLKSTEVSSGIFFLSATIMLTLSGWNFRKRTVIITVIGFKCLYCYILYSKEGIQLKLKGRSVSIINMALQNLLLYWIQDIIEYLYPCLVHLQHPPVKLVNTDMVHVAGKELPLPDLNVFGLKVLFRMSSVETLVVRNDY